MPFSSSFLSFILFSLSGSGKAEMLPQNNFADMMEKHNVANHYKKMCTHYVTKL